MEALAIGLEEVLMKTIYTIELLANLPRKKIKRKGIPVIWPIGDMLYT